LRPLVPHRREPRRARGDRAGGTLPCGLMALCAAIVPLLVASSASACDTPVYRYALDNWPREPYVVFLFHDGRRDAAQPAVVRRIDELSGAAATACKIENGKPVCPLTTGPAVNLEFRSVDVRKIGTLPEQPPERRLWLRHRRRNLPFYVVLSPRGGEVYVGDLKPGELEALVSSPARERMARMLCGGKTGLLLLLKGSHAEENTAAEKTAQAAVQAARERKLDVGFLAVERDAPAERWLVRQLLAVEEDLSDLHRPMVFGVFGRGHVLEPYVGKGITTKHMAELIGYLTGPCTCVIKDACPGVDLLTRWNWTEQASTAAALPDPGLTSALADFGRNAEGGAAATSASGTAQDAERASQASRGGLRPMIRNLLIVLGIGILLGGGWSLLALRRGRV